MLQLVRFNTAICLYAVVYVYMSAYVWAFGSGINSFGNCWLQVGSWN